MKTEETWSVGIMDFGGRKYVQVETLAHKYPKIQWSSTFNILCWILVLVHHINSWSVFGLLSISISVSQHQKLTNRVAVQR